MQDMQEFEKSALEKEKRKDLDAIAAKAGVTDPEKLENKNAVIDAMDALDHVTIKAPESVPDTLPADPSGPTGTAKSPTTPPADPPKPTGATKAQQALKIKDEEILAKRIHGDSATFVLKSGHRLRYPDDVEQAGALAAERKAQAKAAVEWEKARAERKAAKNAGK